MIRSPLRIAVPLTMHLSGVVIAFVLLALAPPAEGEMRLVALAADAPRVQIARAAGALIVTSSGDDGLVVRGSRARLFWPMLRAGVLTLATSRTACGELRA